MFLDGIGVLIATVPVLLPIAAQFEVDPIHFGVVLATPLFIGSSNRQDAVTALLGRPILSKGKAIVQRDVHTASSRA
ncbi:hypothetical protein RLEG12_08530 (plasmid) [Rhizobium leguminosarum bv. trifolii CB782]|nr:hypothetical protein RLEG12_08530 [Rhizobium leguminosarum bv. trifolii CB782]